MNRKVMNRGTKSSYTNKQCAWAVVWCGTVGRVVASETIGPVFESSHQQFL